MKNSNGIMLVGEAMSEKDDGRPFGNNWLLNGLLSQVGIRFSECARTNVFNLTLSDVKSVCGAKADGIPGLPSLVKGKYVLAKYAGELERLYDEIRRENPNVIVALGATAAWALCRSAGIKAIRGAATSTHDLVSARLGRSFKVLPTYHPSAISREWALRPVALSDLDKARNEAGYPDIRRPSREIWTAPSLSDLAEYERDYILPADELAADIETKGDQITCIGFAPDPRSAIVIPFYAPGYPGCNYWPTLADELAAWAFVRRWLAIKPTIFQNGLYDIHFLWRRYGIPALLARKDTMLIHHAQQPEMEKGLGFLGTLYTNEASWKFMRKTETVKKGD